VAGSRLLSARMGSTPGFVAALGSRGGELRSCHSEGLRPLPSLPRCARPLGSLGRPAWSASPGEESPRSFKRVLAIFRPIEGPKIAPCRRHSANAGLACELRHSVPADGLRACARDAIDDRRSAITSRRSKLGRRLPATKCQAGKAYDGNSRYAMPYPSKHPAHTLTRRSQRAVSARDRRPSMGRRSRPPFPKNHEPSPPGRSRSRPTGGGSRGGERSEVEKGEGRRPSE
jgi:hypothetical protein